MPRRIKHVETLIYYDGPELFHATDQFGSHYLCLLVSGGDEGWRFATVPVRLEQLGAFCHGHVDLRTLFATPDVPERYFIDWGAAPVVNDEIPLHPVDRFPEEWLPEEGFVLEWTEAEASTLVQEASTRNRAVIHLSLDPPEARREATIEVTHLIEALGAFQSVLKYAYKKAIANLSARTRQLLSAPENYAVEAFAFSPGSFTVHLQSKTSADLVGHVDIQQALQKIDEISLHLANPEAAIETLQAHRGHLARAYQRFLRFVVENDAPVAYSWATPGIRVPHSRIISRSDAIRVYELLNARQDLTTEIVELIGRVVKADWKSGAWTLEVEEEGREYRGYVADPSSINLSGIVLAESIYRFVCEERIEEVLATGEEKKYLFLLTFAPVASV